MSHHPRLSAVIVTSMLLLGACSDSEASTCGAAQDLADAVRDLGEVDLGTEGRDEVERALDDVGAAWDELADAAGDQFGDEIDSLETSVDDAGQAVAEAPEADDLRDAGSSISDALGDVGDAWGSLSSSVQAELGDCDLSGD